jgi:Tfp pilus assembly protein PilF
MKAVQLDPQSPQPQEALGDLWAVRALYRGLAGNPIDSECAQGDAAVRRALELGAEPAQPLATLGLISLLRLDFQAAEGCFKKSLELAPNNAVAHDWYGDYFRERGRLDLATEEYRKAEKLDPLSLYILSDLGWMLIYTQRFAEALVVLEQAETISPGTVRIGVPRAFAMAKLGQQDRARKLVRGMSQSLAASENKFRATSAIYVLRQIGAQTEAEEFAAPTLAQLPADSGLRGLILLALGRTDEGFSLMERLPVFGGHSRTLFWNVEFDPVRGDPRFLSLINRLRISDDYRVGRETMARMLKDQTVKN